MNDFATDNAWSNTIRERLLLPHYRDLHNRRGLFGNWKSSQTEYEQSRGDALFKTRTGVIGIEEKIVRWPRRGEPYTAIPLETMSCTVEGYEKVGWMATGRYDWLLHIRVNADEMSAECDAFAFPELKAWFIEQDCERWPLHREKEHNQTESVIVPLEEIRAITKSFQFKLPGGGIGEIFGHGPFRHYCPCGLWGSFGYGVSLLKGEEGMWFCGAHRPAYDPTDPTIWGSSAPG